MDLGAFKAAVSSGKKPEKLTSYLEAMYADGTGDWHKAHEIAQNINDSIGSLIHAYLHRKEGDEWNANYWYKRAGRNMPKYSVSEEWEKIVIELLEQNS